MLSCLATSTAIRAETTQRSERFQLCTQRWKMT